MWHIFSVNNVERLRYKVKEKNLTKSNYKLPMIIMVSILMFDSFLIFYKFTLIYQSWDTIIYNFKPTLFFNFVSV